MGYIRYKEFHLVNQKGENARMSEHDENLESNLKLPKEWGDAVKTFDEILNHRSIPEDEEK